MSIASPPNFAFPEGLAAASLKRFTVAEYHSMIDAGVFAKDENFELLEGLVIHKMTKHPDHCIATGLLIDALAALGLTGFFVQVQDPITTKDSEPEPDLALVCGMRRDYRTGHPNPRQVPLVIEVADSTLAEDRGVKKRIYATARIPIYWIVNLVDHQIEIYTRPSGPTKKPSYKDCEIIPASGTAAVVVDGKEVGRIRVQDVLP